MDQEDDVTPPLSGRSLKKTNMQDDHSGLLLHEWVKSSRTEGGKVNSPQRLTDDHEDEDNGGHSSADVEHDPDVVRQLIYVLHIGHENGRDQEPNGNAQLQRRVSQ